MLFSFAWLWVSFGLSWEVSFKSSSLSLFTPQLPVGILLSKVSKIYKKYAFFPSPYFHTSLKAGCTSLSSTTCFGTRRIWENNDHIRWQVSHDKSYRTEVFSGCDLHFLLFCLLSTLMMKEIRFLRQYHLDKHNSDEGSLSSLDVIPLVVLRLYKKLIKLNHVSCCYYIVKKPC